MTRNQALNQWGQRSSVEAFAAYSLIGRVCQDVALGEVQIQTFMVNELSAAVVTVGGVSQGEGKDKAPAATALIAGLLLDRKKTFFNFPFLLFLNVASYLFTSCKYHISHLIMNIG